MPFRRVSWLLLVLIALAAFLRLRGLDRELPHAPEPDSHLVLQIELLREGRAPDLKQSEKGYYAYPLPLAQVLALWPAEQAAPDAALSEHLAAASSDAFRGRLAVALLSLLLIPATWMLARRFTTPLGAVLATLFTATSLLHLEFSQQARHHAPHASFALLAVLAALQLRECASWGRYLAASALALLALGMLHSGWFALLPIVAAHFLRERDERRASSWAIALPIATCLFAWFALYPRESEDMNPEASWATGGHTFHLSDLSVSGFATGARLLWDYDPGLSVAAALGAAFVLFGGMRSWRELDGARKRELVVALSYALPYGLALGVYTQTVDRMLLPLVPFLAVLGGIGMVTLAGKLPAVARIGVVAAALVTPSLGALRYASVRDADDTYEQAAEWLEANAQGRVLFGTRFTLPLASDAAALELARSDHASRQRRWVRYQLEHGPLPQARDFALVPGKLLAGAEPEKAKARLEAFLLEQKPEWIAIEVTKFIRANPMLLHLRDWSISHGTLERTWRGEPAERDMEPSLDYQDMPHLFWRLLYADAFGPTIELYRISR